MRPFWRSFGLGVSAFALGVGLVAVVPVATPAGAASKGVIQIGFLASLTGPEQSSVIPTEGVMLGWADYTNAHGGILGHKVQIDVKNDSANPSVSVTDAHALVEQDHVIAIEDNTNEDAAWASYVQQMKVPVVGQAISQYSFNTNPDFFPEGQTAPAVGTSMALAAQKAGAKKLSIFYCAEVATCPDAAIDFGAAGAKIGVPLVYKTAIRFDAPNYDAECLAAKQAGADAIWVADGVAELLSAASDCVAQGFKPIQVIDDGSVVGSMLTAPGTTNFISVQPVLPFSVKSTPAQKEMYKALAKYDPAGLQPANLGEEVEAAWASATELKAAIELSGKATAAGVTAGLYMMKGDTLDGLTSPLTYKKGVAHTINCWFYMRDSNGKFTTPYGLKPACHAPL